MITTNLLNGSEMIERMVGDLLGDAPVPGWVKRVQIEGLLRFAQTRQGSRTGDNIGRTDCCSSLGLAPLWVAAEPDPLLYADMARWEIQQQHLVLFLSLTPLV